jgi:hypothetical protein
VFVQGIRLERARLEGGYFFGGGILLRRNAQLTCIDTTFDRQARVPS